MEARGTGAVTTIHGTGTHGPSPHGDITAGTIRSMWEAGMTHGITADSTTLGTMEAGVGTTGTATIITRTTAAGTEAGTLTTDMDTGTYTGRDTPRTNRAVRDTTITSGDRDIRQDPTGCSQAGHHSEADPASETRQAETPRQCLRARPQAEDQAAALQREEPPQAEPQRSRAAVLQASGTA